MFSRVLVALCLAAAGWLAWVYFGGDEPAVPPAALEPAPPPPDFTPDIRFPAPEPAPRGDEPAPLAPQLPALAASDGPVSEAVAAVIGEDAARSWLLPRNLVRNAVLAVDSLGRGPAALKPELRPVNGVPGTFPVSGSEESLRLDPANYARYDALVRLVDAVDAARLAAVYLRYYALFQQAYEEVGPAGAYFNDRLVAVIDDLLAAPQLAEPPALVQPRVYYEYADPSLEARSSGQKLLVRMGPDHAMVVKRKLRELRAAVTGQPVP